MTRVEGDREIRVLDVGCGRGRDFGPNAHVVAVDVSRPELDANSYADEKILGDIQELSLPRESFDLIHCQDVLEHLARPDHALERMWDALAPGGTMHLGIPNVRSAKARIAKATPHRFHVLAMRWIFGLENAGREGYGPYPTYLRPFLRPESLSAWVSARGGTIEIKGYTGAAVEQLRTRSRHRFWWLPIEWIVGAGRVRDSDFEIVIRR